MGLALMGTFQNQSRRFSDEINKRLEKIKKDFMEQINIVEDQISQINERELQLTRAINRLAEITAHIGRKQEDFQNLQFAIDKQLLEQQIADTRTVIENRKLALSINARDTQREIEEYNLRKLILNTLKSLKSIPDLRNDTIYSNRIRRGTLINTEIYRIINQSQTNASNWEKQHLIKQVNTEQQRKNLEENFKRHRQNFVLTQDLEDLQDIVEMTMKPVEVYNFAYHFVPITVPEQGIEIFNEGIGNVIQLGSDIVDKGTDLITNVADKGVGLVSEPIKIIVIAASIVGGIILLFAGITILRKVLREEPTYRVEHANNITTHVIPVPVYSIISKRQSI